MTNALEKWIFPILGLPTILHSDNGREFVNHLIEDVLATCPGAVQLVSATSSIARPGGTSSLYTGTNDEFQNCSVSI